MLLVRDIMETIPCYLVAGQSLGEAWLLLGQRRKVALPVLDHNSVVVGALSGEALFNLDPRLVKWDNSLDDFLSPCCLIAEDIPWEKARKEIDKDIAVVINAQGQPVGIIHQRLLEGYRSCQRNMGNILHRMEAILDAANNGIIAIDKQGVVTIFNHAAEQITRRRKPEALGKHLSEVIIPLGLLDVLETGRGELHKFSVRYSSGTHVYITNRSPIVENGEVIGAIGVFQDISELESISEELQVVKELNRELQAIIDSSYDGIIITDADGQVIRVNDAHERITGIKSEEIQGKSMRQLVDEGYYSKSVVEAVLRQGKAVTLMERVKGGVTNTKYLLVTGSPVRDAKNGIARVVINVRDLTELSQLRQQLEETRELSERYRTELTQMRSRMVEQKGIVFNSPKMQDLLVMVMRVAQVDSTILILGESGVGKEVVAKLIHTESLRNEGPFIKVNCGAIPENLLESELFGYEPGAFTGASKEGKLGMFELAHNGTLFLDEIGDLPLSLQVKLLRAIQDREIVRVGGNKPRAVNVRILAATNHNLEEMVQRGLFREDLYFRLNVVPLYIPPLRMRREEIIPLVYAFINKYGKAYNITKEFAPEVFEIFLNYDWPGNVRELENIVERLMVTTPDTMVTAEHVPANLLPRPVKSENPSVIVRGILPLKEAVSELERQLISRAVSECGSTYKAAVVLGVNQSTVVRKMKKN
ncbi:MAG: sigma 54-interacting transcriptional regulator [Bacillota bacterium]